MIGFLPPIPLKPIPILTFPLKGKGRSLGENWKEEGGKASRLAFNGFIGNFEAPTK
jgi:hypothetical protein